MEKKLNLKTIDTPLKAFLIGSLNCSCWKTWKDGQEFLNKDIALLSFSLSQYNENEQQCIKRWFNKTFYEYGQCYIKYVPYPKLYLELQITPESKDNIKEKYIPIKKELYDYYIRGMFCDSLIFRSKNTYLYYSYCFTNINNTKIVGYPQKCIVIEDFKNWIYSSMHINGNKNIISTISKKLNDYYGLSNFIINKFYTLIYQQDNKNIEYFNSVFEKTQDLFDFEF